MKIVLALGGNALGNTLLEQMEAVKITCRAVADLIEQGHELVITHGNGPQVGMINVAMDELHKVDPKTSVIPMSVCVAMSEAYIGYDLQNMLREELLSRNIHKSVCTLITQVSVDKNDPAFANPAKPIGRFMSKEEADELSALGYKVIEDSGRGLRRVVASPKPQTIIELESIKALVNAGQVVVACGGGGIPVVFENNHLRGVGAVIDKDLSSAQLAKSLDADCLIILTAVEKVALNFGKPDVSYLDKMNVAQAEKYIAEGHFAPGSMLPKVLAAKEFAQSKKGRFSIITLLKKASLAIQGKTGTIITNE